MFKPSKQSGFILEEINGFEWTRGFIVEIDILNKSYLKSQIKAKTEEF